MHVDKKGSTRVQRPAERRPPQALGGAVLIACAAEHRWVIAEGDDGAGTYCGAGLDSSAMPSVEDVEAALTNVIDPELGLDFVELGLIYGIEVSGGETMLKQL